MTAATIAIDATGGDFGPPVTVPASIQILTKYKNLNLILVGDETILKKSLKAFQYDTSRLIIHHASQRVEMDESPAIALRTKKDSSMRVAINLVKEGKADACVSAGNTGALMATARFVLKTLPGVDRPAIISKFPTKNNKNVRILDLGANVDSTAEHLFQFAIMASVLASAIDNIPNPSVYLLNIGSEEMKGNELVRQASSRFSGVSALNYAGFIEADQIYKGIADIVVCDGFVGNVALKTTEGVSKFISGMIKEAFMRNAYTKMIGLLVKPILRSFIKRINPDLYNGAIFIGLQGTVIKSHGGAKTQAFVRAIEEAIINVEKNIPEQIKHEVARLLNIH